MTHVFIAQCLCGPNRHAIVGCASEFDNEAEAAVTLVPRLREGIALMRGEGMNPWCGICGAPEQGWSIEIGRTRFATMEEAGPEIAISEARNLLGSALFGTHGSEPPKKQ